jgi:hypothetical protein
LPNDLEIAVEEWCNILIKHEQMIGVVNAADITKSILPYYLLRVVTYLMSVSNRVEAKKIIDQEASLALSLVSCLGF